MEPCSHFPPRDYAQLLVRLTTDLLKLLEELQEVQLDIIRAADCLPHGSTWTVFEVDSEYLRRKTVLDKLLDFVVDKRTRLFITVHHDAMTSVVHPISSRLSTCMDIDRCKWQMHVVAAFASSMDMCMALFDSSFMTPIIDDALTMVTDAHTIATSRE